LRFWQFVPAITMGFGGRKPKAGDCGLVIRPGGSVSVFKSVGFSLRQDVELVRLAGLARLGKWAQIHENIEEIFVGGAFGRTSQSLLTDKPFTSTQNWSPLGVPTIKSAIGVLLPIVKETV
jgi:hypothetical protein